MSVRTDEPQMKQQLARAAAAEDFLQSPHTRANLQNAHPSFKEEVSISLAALK